MSNNLSVVVFGEKHEFDLDDLFSSNINRNITKLLLLYSESIYQHKQLENEFKTHRSEFYSRQLRRDSKLPEWKLKLRYEQSDECKQYKEGLARAERTTNRICAIVDGLKYKSIGLSMIDIRTG